MAMYSPELREKPRRYDLQLNNPVSIRENHIVMLTDQRISRTTPALRATPP